MYRDLDKIKLNNAWRHGTIQNSAMHAVLTALTQFKIRICVGIWHITKWYNVRRPGTIHKSIMHGVLTKFRIEKCVEFKIQNDNALRHGTIQNRTINAGLTQFRVSKCIRIWHNTKWYNARKCDTVQKSTIQAPWPSYSKNNQDLSKSWQYILTQCLDPRDNSEKHHAWSLAQFRISQTHGNLTKVQTGTMQENMQNS